jgi:hypothetical protein
MSNRFDKWDRWLDAIHEEVRILLMDKYIFWEVQKMIKNNPSIQKPSAFYEFFGSIYGDSALMGIRRQVKIDKKSISLARLLDEICKTPEILSRNRYIELYDNYTKKSKLPDKHFEKFAGKTRDHVDPHLVKLDLEQLRSKFTECEKYADRRVAHYDRRAPKRIPTFKELNECINFLEKLVKKYLRLFRGKTYIQILPVFQYDWEAIFREPWLR